jgi:hypothetical protein
MRHSVASTAKNTAQKTTQKQRKVHQISAETPALDRCYGQIGISAVAAAVRYQGVSKNPAYAPVEIGWYDRTEDAAA